MGPSADLLDAYLAAAAPGALAGTALRDGTAPARRLLARAAGLDLGDLLVAARTGDHRWLARRVFDADALAELARVLAGADETTADALAVLDLLAAAGRPVPATAQALHATLVYAAGDRARAARLLRRYAGLPAAVRTALAVDLANPYLGAPARKGRRWWAAFAGLLAPCGLTVEDGPGEPFDRLAAAVPAGRAERRLSVIVTAYRPDAGLLTAVRSVLAQSWAPAEVLVVDDASPAGYDAVLDACAALDPRVQVLRLDVNGGTYRARNVGLATVTGELVTFQDSDDWSHPLRLERQARALLGAPGALAVTSAGIEVTERFRLSRPGYPRISRLNPSSLLLRRAEVRALCGGFDEVRKGADSELIDRMNAVHGPGAVRHVDEPLALIRLSADSLSRGEVRAAWLHPARAAYASAYRAWHARVAAGEADPRLGATRPFAAPAHMTGRPAGDRHYDVVLLTDWTVGDGPRRAAREEVVALTGAGLRVAVAQLPSYRRPSRRRRALWRGVQDLVNDGVVDQVTTAERARAGLLLVRDPAVLQFADRPGWFCAERVAVVADEGRYDRADCAAAALDLAGVAPQWTDDWPAVVDPAAWRVDRPARLPARPVIGFDLPGMPDPALVAELAGYDVRVRAEDPRGLPVTWLAYDLDELSGREFVAQLDVYLAAGPGREAVEALAGGCIVVLRAGGDRTPWALTGVGPAVLAGADLGAVRRAAAGFLAGHRPADLVARVTALLDPPGPPAPAQRSAVRAP